MFDEVHLARLKWNEHQRPAYTLIGIVFVLLRFFFRFDMIRMAAECSRRVRGAMDNEATKSIASDCRARQMACNGATDDDLDECISRNQIILSARLRSTWNGDVRWNQKSQNTAKVITFVIINAARAQIEAGAIEEMIKSKLRNGNSWARIPTEDADFWSKSFRNKNFRASDLSHPLLRPDMCTKTIAISRMRWISALQSINS